MATKPLPKRIDGKSVGSFDPKAWLQEGDGLLASAKANRELWLGRKRSFVPTGTSKTKLLTQERKRDEILGLPRASMLLLGYSVEMFLKASLAKAYQGCAEKVFADDLKFRFGHDLSKIAKEVAFPSEVEDGAKFKLLKDMLSFDARYPVTTYDESTYLASVNQRTQVIWDNDNFTSLVKIANRVRAHALQVGRDVSNPSIIRKYSIDEDGYLTLRIGGNLPPRITFRLSSNQQAEETQTSLERMYALFIDQNEDALISHYWNMAFIYEDALTGSGQRRTLKCRSRPENEC
ncbi:hypothetical protein ACTL6U_11040 [Rhodovibrionaceae bacterium A322]